MYKKKHWEAFTFLNTLRVLQGMSHYLAHHSYNPIIIDFFTDILREKLKSGKQTLSVADIMNCIKTLDKIRYGGKTVLERKENADDNIY